MDNYFYYSWSMLFRCYKMPKKYYILTLKINFWLGLGFSAFNLNLLSV